MATAVQCSIFENICILFAETDWRLESYRRLNCSVHDGVFIQLLTLHKSPIVISDPDDTAGYFA